MNRGLIFASVTESKQQNQLKFRSYVYNSKSDAKRTDKNHDESDLETLPEPPTSKFLPYLDLFRKSVKVEA